VTEHGSWRVRVDDHYSPRGVTTPTRYEYRIRRDHDQIDITGHSLSLDKNTATKPNRTRDVVNDKLYVSYAWLTTKRGLPDRATASRDLRRYLEDVTPIAAGYYGGPLDGYAGRNSTRLAERLLKADTARILKQQAIDGVTCKIVRGHTPLGTIELALAENKGCLPLRAVCEKGPDDLDEDNKTRIGKEKTGPRLDQPTVRVSCVLDRVVVAAVDGYYVTVGGRWTRTERASDGTGLATEDICKRWDIDLHPSFKGTDAFKIDLAEGARVDLEDDENSGVVYKWHNGDVVPAYAAFTGVTDRFAGGRAWWVTLMWAGIGLTLLLIGGWVLVRLKRLGRTG
jgi:hypothetical protein